jgi:Kinesin motor domain
VWGPASNNQQIYTESIEQEIEGALQGYNTSILLYGVTGSGKTHTVFGNLGYLDSAESTEQGLVYHCFRRVMKEPSTAVSISYIEIYNEQVKDLLGSDDNLNVNENAQGEVVIQGLSCQQIDSFDDMIDIVKQGNTKRKVAKTCANAFSSRSHALLQIHIRKKSDKGQIIHSKITFVDLAGSERVELTQNKGT